MRVYDDLINTGDRGKAIALGRRIEFEILTGGR